MIDRTDRKNRIVPENLHWYFRMIDIVNSTDSFNKKAAILLANKADEVLPYIVRYLCGDIVSNIGRHKLEKPVFYRVATCQVNSIKELLQYYETHPTGDEDDIIVTQDFLRRLPRETREDYKKLICKEISLNCGNSTIQKAYGEEIFSGRKRSKRN